MMFTYAKYSTIYVRYGDYMLNSANRKIWRGLVDYANAGDLESDSKAFNCLAQTLSECMPWMARTAFEEDVPAMIVLRTNPKDSLGRVALWPWSKSAEQLATQFRQQAIEYQPQVRQLLTWLSDRSKNEKDRPGAYAFLREHTIHVEFAHGDPAFAPDEEQDRYFTTGGELKDDFPERTLSYKDLADVICDFIQKEHELRREVPIRICERPGCGNLVIQFKKRKYCRTPVCDRERRKRDDDVKQRKNRDNVFLCRLRTMPLAMRRKKVRESAERLLEIEAYWRDKNQSLANHALDLLKKRIVPDPASTSS
jgi:hypothetical protein